MKYAMARGLHCLRRCRRSRAAQRRSRASQQPSAPDARSVPACLRASTYSWPSKSPKPPWAAPRQATLQAARPCLFTVAPTYSPLGVVTFSSIDTATPAFFAKASAAAVGCAVFEGHLPRRARQLFFGVGLAGEHALNQHCQAPGSGVGGDLAAGPSRRSRVSRSLTRRPSSASAAAIMRAGTSSSPISNRKSDIIVFLSLNGEQSTVVSDQWSE